MSLRDKYDGWIKAYVKAWNSNEPNEIADLFTPHARYLTEPYAQPWVGQEQIVEQWLEAKDEPGDTSFDHEVIAATEDLGIVKGRTHYKGSGKTYANLWEIRLGHADRCREFVEWWMEEKDS